MGILADFLRASDTAVVVEAMEQETRKNRYFIDESFSDNIESSDDDPEEPSFGLGLDAIESIDATGMHDDELLTELIAVIRRVRVSPGLGSSTMVWPTGSFGPEEPDEDDPCVTGPWVTEFDSDVRDTLAGVNDAELSDVAARWGDTEAARVFDAEPDVLLDVVKRLVRFARDARREDQRLYRWVSL